VINKILIVAGARPNFIKIAPIIRAFKKLPNKRRPRAVLVHTGQHYDYRLSRIFFEHLEIPRPDVYLRVGSGPHAWQIAEIMRRFIPVLSKERPGLVMVVGDVNSTLACALAAYKSGVPVAHVEAGLRSFDESMPEESNRKLTDHISQFLFTHSREAKENLRREGLSSKRIFLVGNVMMDSLLRALPQAEQRPILKNLGLVPKGYILATLHRPSNVDDPTKLTGFIMALSALASEKTVVLPAHPRTLAVIEKMGRSRMAAGKVGFFDSLARLAPNCLNIIPALGYLDFLRLEQQAAGVITDSGGVQEETSFLGVPCLTVRDNTERPVTVRLGTNRVIGSRPEAILEAWEKIKKDKGRKVRIPKWDGRAGERIVGILSGLKP